MLLNNIWLLIINNTNFVVVKINLMKNLKSQGRSKLELNVRTQDIGLVNQAIQMN